MSLCRIEVEQKVRTPVAPEGQARVIHSRNPFDTSKHKHEFVEIGEQLFLSETIPDNLKDHPEELVVASINGAVIPMEDWGTAVVSEGDVVVIFEVPGGDDAKSILRLIAMLVIAYFAPWLGGFLYTGTSAFVTAAVQIGIIVAGAVLVNAILPPVAPGSTLSEDFKDSRTYGIDGAKNTSDEGAPLPVCYGPFRMAGNVINFHTRNIGNDQFLYLLLNAGEGVSGGLSNIELNEQPIDGFLDAEVQTRFGGADLELINWFQDTISPVAVGVVVTTSFQQRTTGVIDRFRLDFVCPQGLVEFRDDGTRVSRLITFDIEYKKVSEPTIWTNLKDQGPVASVATRYDYHQYDTYDAEGNVTGTVSSDTGRTTLRDVTDVVTNQVISDQHGRRVGHLNNEAIYTRAPDVRAKQVSAVRFSYYSPELVQDTYDIRVRRTIAESTDPKIKDSVTWTDYNEIIQDDVAYKNTALVGLKIRLTDQLSSFPTVTYMNQGRAIKYWHTDQQVWFNGPTTNPAWIAYDAMTNERFGGGIALTRIDQDAWLEWGEYCDNNGLTFQGVFDTRSNLWDSLMHIFRAGHARPIKMGTRFSLAIDRETNATQMFSVGNIVKDSFSQNWVSLTDRANEVELHYFDETDRFKRRTIKVYDDLTLADAPRNTATVTMYGIVGKLRAAEEATYMLLNNRYVKSIVSFKVAMEAVAVVVGDVFLLQHDQPDWAEGGRLAPGSTTTNMEGDRDFTYDGAKSYKALVRYDSLTKVTATITGITAGGRRIALGAPFTGQTDIDRIVKSGGPDLRITRVESDAVWVNDSTGLLATDSVDLVQTDAIEVRDVVAATSGTQPTIPLATALPQAPDEFSVYMIGEDTILAIKQVTTFVELVPVISTVYRITISGVNYEFLTTDVLPATLVNGLLAVVNADPDRVMDATNVGDELVLTAINAGRAYIAIQAVDSPGIFDSVTETTPASTGESEWRTTKIVVDKDLNVTITGATYDERIYNWTPLTIQPAPDTGQSRIVPHVINLDAVEANINIGGILRPVLDISWDLPDDFESYEGVLVETNVEGEGYKFAKTQRGGLNTTIEIGHGTNLDVRVVAMSNDGRFALNSSAPEVLNITFNGDIFAPAAVTGFALSKGTLGIHLSWVNPTDADFASLSIKRNTVDNEGTATFVFATEKSQVSWDDILATTFGTDYFYWAQSVDFTGNTSAQVASTPISETPPLSGAGIDATSGFLTNENHGVPSDTDGGNPVFTAANGEFKVFKGTADIIAGTTFSIFSADNLTGTINTALNTPVTGPKGYYEVTAETVAQDVHSFVVRAVTADGITIDKVFTLTKSKAGVDGATGSDGFNSATVSMYNKNTSSSTPPAAFSGTFTYTFSTAVLSGGTPNGWTTAAPAIVAGEFLWVRRAVAVSITATDSVPTGDFSAAVVASVAGSDGAAGGAGSDGLNNATVYLFNKNTSSITPPAAFTGTFTYTFSTGVLSGGTLNGWTQDAPSVPAGEFLWARAAVASSNTITDSVPTAEFSAAVVQSGTGVDGGDGTDGLNTATVSLYNKNTSSSTPPAAFSGTFTYTFSTAVLSGGTLNGWTTAAPDIVAGEFLWVRRAAAISSTSTDSVPTAEFSAAVVASVAGSDGATGGTGPDGTDGLNSATVSLFNKNTSSATPPAAFTGTFTYTFSTGVLSGGTLNGWTQDQPDIVAGEFLWARAAVAVSNTATDSVPTSEFSAAVVMSGTGTDGADGSTGATGNSLHVAQVFLRKSTVPVAPLTDDGSYNFGTGVLTPPDIAGGSADDWQINAPAGTDDLYVSSGLFEISGATGTDSTVVWSAPARLASDGLDGVLHYLTNEAHVTPANNDGTGYSLVGAGGTHEVFDGVTNKTLLATHSIVGTQPQNGLTMSVDANGIYSLTGASWTTDIELFTIRANYNGVNYDKVYTIAKAKQGGDGGCAIDTFTTILQEAFGTGVREAGVQLHTDGTIDVKSGDGSAAYTNKETWIGACTNTNYQVRLNKLSGTTPTGALIDTWLACSTIRSWELSSDTPQLFTGTMDIRRTSDSQILGTVGVTLEVGHEVLVTNIDETLGPTAGGPRLNIRFADNGQIQKANSTTPAWPGTQIHGGEWFKGEPQVGIGASYDIRTATMAVGTWDVQPAAVGTWVGLETEPVWAEHRTTGKGGEGSGTDTATGNMEIRDGSSLVVVATFTMKITVIKS